MTETAAHAAVARDLRDRGFRIEERAGGAVARGGTPPVEVDAPLGIRSLRDARPLTVVSAVATAAHDGTVPVLVADPHTETEMEPLLSAPFLLEGRADGREFVPIEDRIRLSDDTYACLGASGPVRWHERANPGTDEPALVLDVGGDPVAVLESVAELACPGPAASAFGFRYARGDDGRFRVFDDGVVGRYTSVGGMRADGFRPAPLPLVPEHHVRDNGQLARATLVAAVDDGAVTYRSVP